MSDDRNTLNDAVDHMREWQERMNAGGKRLAQAQAEHDEAVAGWQAAREQILMVQPTSAAGAVALLRWVAHETDSLDRELLASAIQRCVAALESGTVCNS